MRSVVCGGSATHAGSSPTPLGMSLGHTGLPLSRAPVQGAASVLLQPFPGQRLPSRAGAWGVEPKPLNMLASGGRLSGTGQVGAPLCHLRAPAPADCAECHHPSWVSIRYHLAPCCVIWEAGPSGFWGASCFLVALHCHSTRVTQVLRETQRFSHCLRLFVSFGHMIKLF